MDMQRFIQIMLVGSLLTNILGAIALLHNAHTIEVNAQNIREMRLTLASLREQQAKNVERLHKLEHR